MNIPARSGALMDTNGRRDSGRFIEEGIPNGFE